MQRKFLYIYTKISPYDYQSRPILTTALNIDTKEKREQETNPLTRVDDSFQKIVVVKDDIIPWTDESGILYIGIQEFLLTHIDRL